MSSGFSKDIERTQYLARENLHHAEIYPLGLKMVLARYPAALASHYSTKWASFCNPGLLKIFDVTLPLLVLASACQNSSFSQFLIINSRNSIFMLTLFWKLSLGNMVSVYEISFSIFQRQILRPNLCPTLTFLMARVQNWLKLDLIIKCSEMTHFNNNCTVNIDAFGKI